MSCAFLFFLLAILWFIVHVVTVAVKSTAGCMCLCTCLWAIAENFVVAILLYRNRSGTWYCSFKGFFFFFRRTYVHFNLCVSVTIYICVLILATQCAEAFNSFFFLAISVFMCTCVCEHVYVCTCLGALSGCCIFFLHTIPSIFF